MGFLSVLLQLCSAASAVLPAVAAVRSQCDPAADNTTLINTAKAMQAVTPLVAHAEAVSAAGPTPMTGAQKLALVQAVVQDAHAQAVQNGITTDSFDTYWTPINAAITAVVAQQKTVTTASS